jgi:hypothetical protein
MNFSSLAGFFLMNSPEVDPLVKQTGHRHPDHENLLKQDERVDSDSHARGDSVFVQIEQENREAVKKNKWPA